MSLVMAQLKMGPISIYYKTELELVCGVLKELCGHNFLKQVEGPPYSYWDTHKIWV